MSYNAENYLLPLEEYLQPALREYNKNADGNSQTWYGWKKVDDEGNIIPNEDRMQHQYIKVIIDGAVIPSKADLDAKMQELRDSHKADLEAQNDKALSGKQKLKDLGLDDDEIAQIYPCGTCPDCIGS
tara:strand:+ start:576 stop:959 length:384 start_codon:yes stop_codon:yes gene_type:complete